MEVLNYTDFGRDLKSVLDKEISTDEGEQSSNCFPE